MRHFEVYEADDGSTMVSVYMRSEQLEKLKAMLETGELEDLKIEEIRRQTYDDILKRDRRNPFEDAMKLVNRPTEEAEKKKTKE